MKLLRFEIWAAILFITLPNGCSSENMRQEETEEVEINLSLPGMKELKSADPGPDIINDVNIFIISNERIIEEHKYLPLENSGAGDNPALCKIRLIKGLKYSVLAFVNFGHKIQGVKSFEELKAYRYHLSYPDEYSRGLPMFGKAEEITAGNKERLEIELERLMSKISLRIDRTKLSQGVTFNVRSVRIGNCPKSIQVLGKSRAKNNMDVFNIGFMKSYGEADGLNIDQEAGVSKAVSLYMLENMNGNLIPGASKDKDKVLDDKPALADICSYIEIKAEYISPLYTNMPGDYLIYRFYLGSGKGNFDIERNCHYNYTVRPEGSGLNEESWRVDITGLKKHS